MKKFCLSIAIIALFILSSFLSAQEEELIKIESLINPKRLSRGEEGRVILKIKVAEGIALSPLPSFIIEFTPNEELVFPKNFFTASDLGLEVIEQGEKEQLNLQKPIEIPFTVSLKAERGIHFLAGKIKYFALSLKEGWCLKKASPFSMTFSTRQTVVRKRSASPHSQSF